MHCSAGVPAWCLTYLQHRVVPAWCIAYLQLQPGERADLTVHLHARAYIGYWLLQPNHLTDAMSDLDPAAGGACAGCLTLQRGGKFTCELCPWTHFSLAEIPVLDGTAGAGSFKDLIGHSQRGAE